MGNIHHKPVILTQVIDRESGELVDECVPRYLWTLFWFMYDTRVGRRVSRTKYAKRILRRQSIRCGEKMIDPRSASTIQRFIELHKIDVREFDGSPSEYKCFNDFFIRKLRPGARPIHEPTRSDLACCPADCRIVVFSSVSESKLLWIKGERFSLAQLFGSRLDLSERLRDGAVAVCRLAPMDYHHWHAPITAMQTHHEEVDGELFSVNPKAVENTDVFTVNKREVIEFKSEHFGYVAMIVVGAAMVGSMVSLVKDHHMVSKGQLHGYFQFGGSTIILIFENNHIKFDDDLLLNSLNGREVLVKVGQSLGRAVSSTTRTPFPAGIYEEE